jgi:PAS domain S-box-containing protein
VLFRSVNTTGARRVGLTPETMIGRTMHDVFPKEIADRQLASVRSVIRTGEAMESETPTHFLGQPRWYHTTVWPVRSEDGQVRSALIIARDVTALHQARTELQEAHRKLMGVREEERRRQATELHDSVGQGLVVFKLTLQNALAQCATPDPDGVRAEIARLADQCDVLIADVRRICQGLYPAMLETLGLAAAMKHLRDTTQAGGIETQLVCKDRLRSLRFDGDVEIALFRIAQEAVTNAIRHGQADRLQIALEYEADTLSLEVRNNGAGFDPDEVRHGGLGLSSMKERAQAVGGELTISSRPGMTLISVRLSAKPLAGREGNE